MLVRAGCHRHSSLFSFSLLFSPCDASLLPVVAVIHAGIYTISWSAQPLALSLVFGSTLLAVGGGKTYHRRSRAGKVPRKGLVIILSFSLFYISLSPPISLLSLSSVPAFFLGLFHPAAPLVCLRYRHVGGRPTPPPCLVHLLWSPQLWFTCGQKFTWEEKALCKIGGRASLSPSSLCPLAFFRLSVCLCLCLYLHLSLSLFQLRQG